MDIIDLYGTFVDCVTFHGILGGMGGPLLCEFESLKSCALDWVEFVEAIWRCAHELHAHGLSRH